MGRWPTQWWGWISNASGCKSWIAKRMFGIISIYDKNGVWALETKAPIGKQYLVCIDFHIGTTPKTNGYISQTNEQKMKQE